MANPSSIIATEPPSRQNTTLRSILFWSHLCTAVAVGTVVAIMSVTGAALAYEKQLLDRAATSHRVQPAPGAARLPLDTLYARVTLSQPSIRVTSLTVYADSAKPVSLGLESRQSIFVDPYTAHVLGDDSAVRAFTNAMLKWHRSLNIGEQVRSPVGTAITGVANLAFLFLIVSGFILWFPRQWSKRAFGAVIRFNPRVKGRARDWNWHHVLGFWSAPVLLFMVTTATFLSYRWPGELLERAVGGAPAAARGGRGGGGPEGGRGGERAGRGGAAASARAERPAAQAVLGGPSLPLEAIGSSLDAIATSAGRQANGWRTIQLRLPREAGGALSVTAATTVGALPNERVQLSVDRKTGALAPTAAANATGRAARIRAWMRPIHTGEAGGIVGQTIAGVASLGAAVLFWTGMALSWRRLRNRAARRVRAVARKEALA